MRIGIVDDDESIIDFVSNTLTRGGHSCTGFRNAASLLAALRRETFDLLLLDWNLPDGSGFDLLRTIREATAPTTAVIMLTSRADKDDTAMALHAGADDYVVKPESATVIAARVEAVLRRVVPAAAAQRYTRSGPYTFDRLTETARIGDEEVALSSKEFQLALVLFENLHRAMSRGYLLETIWQSVADLATRTLDMHVSRVRTKLRLSPENGYRIVAISGYGYRLERFGAEGE